jgi:hypothetical protein
LNGSRVGDKAAMQNFVILQENGPLIVLDIQKTSNNQPNNNCAPKKQNSANDVRSETSVFHQIIFRYILA